MSVDCPECGREYIDVGESGAFTTYIHDIDGCGEIPSVNDYCISEVDA